MNTPPRRIGIASAFLLLLLLILLLVFRTPRASRAPTVVAQHESTPVGEPASPPAAVSTARLPAQPEAGRSDKSDEPGPFSQTNQPAPLSPAIGATLPPPSPQPSLAVPAAASASPSVDTGVDAGLDNLQFALRDYRAALGGNPVGTNAEITAALLGDNLRQLRLPLPQGSTLDRSGQLTDPWGTPYFFHQLSGTRMELRSAGPDRRMWTADDAVR